MKIKARTKYVDLYKNYAHSYLIAIISYVLCLTFFAVLIFIWLSDWLISGTIIACAVVGFISFIRPSETVEITINDEQFAFSSFVYSLSELKSWAMVDLGETIEFLILTNNPTQPFEYLYINENDDDIKYFIEKMQELIPYDALIPQKNYVHRLLRFLKLK